MHILVDEKLHAERLLNLLETGNPCSVCPHPPMADRKILKNHYCRRCLTFIGLDIQHYPNENRVICPCHRKDYTRDEIIKLSWIAIEAGGYLEKVND